MKYTKVAIVLLIIGGLISSCNMPNCENKRPIFNQYQPEDLQYKAELVRLIDSIGKQHFRYWINDYLHRDDRDFVSVFVQSETVCAVTEFDITDAKKLEQYKSISGKGYSGAELKGLNYSIDNDGDSIQFILHDVDRIVD